MCLKPQSSYEEPFSEFNNQQRDGLGKGLFWLTENDLGTIQLTCCKVLCSPNGEELEAENTEREKLNHERVWAALDKNITRNKPYNYYPRGRVEIKKRKATIYLHPIMYDKEVLVQVMAHFGLYRRNGLKDIRIKSDHSKRYRFLMEI